MLRVDAVRTFAESLRQSRGVHAVKYALFVCSIIRLEEEAWIGRCMAEIVICPYRERNTIASNFSNCYVTEYT